ncbi:hypothetical protein CONPUDRAFT_129354 [Coniophora puteana RWD-64-598 SS2]|uniref:Uncharacterized protein n=1 Tax=Coniophora puteana (strain RWD-64-598) TaxID=741705 RepID=A0A5M3MD64_CONPW|nr:uncharacterized protein CONPUDRAFT_129354 [Coniophora puteana RWD-64-598 SS2]EIW77158.1 hypothetical protein CONPUDRAFT_129354 [Coniophora puteana RWD-64-598 SS2]
MSSGHHHGTSSSPEMMRGVGSSSRAGSAAFSFTDPGVSSSFQGQAYDPSRPQSSGSAMVMGDVYRGSVSSQASWAELQPPQQSAYQSSALQPGAYQQSQYSDFASVNASPESISPHSPAIPGTPYAGSGGYATQLSRSVAQHPTSYPPQQSGGSSRRSSLEDEILFLRRKVRELELVNESDRMRIRELEGELASGLTIPEQSYRYPGGSPSAMGQLASTPVPQSTAFHSSWRARTEARVRLFCSLNRAGNALCSWHDSRRERRAYPPRMAPPGYLNCGCTHEEALFEESLSRHGVGSYHPGETVRMDPALRNPLLHLLKERYGYRDGDFERDRITGDWVEGEGGHVWEQRALAGSTNARKNRVEDRR